MGAEGSQVLKKEDISELVSATHFDEKEIVQLWGSFKEIAAKDTDDGGIDVSEFTTMLGLKSLQFAEKIFKAFDDDPDNIVDFREFVKGLSQCSSRATIQEKACFVFRVYDLDKNGTISKEELVEVMTLSLRENSNIKINDQMLNKIVDSTIKAMDQNNDGQISLKEFVKEAVKNPSILNCVSVDVERLLHQ